MAYTYLAADLATGELLADLPLIGVKWGRALNGSGPFTGRLPVPPPATTDARRLALHYKAVTDRKTKVIYALRDGTPMGAWLVHARRWDMAAQTWEIKGAELWSHVDQQVFGLGPNKGVSFLHRYAGTPVAVASAILAAEVAPGVLDLSGISAPAGGPTITYEGRATDGHYAGQVIADLAKAEGDLGFDYRVDLTGSMPDLTRRVIMAPIVGADVGLIAKVTRVDGISNVVQGAVIEDERRVTGVLALGQATGELRAAGRADSTDWAPPTRTIITYSDEASASTLAARARARLRATKDLAIPDISLRSDQLDAQLGNFNPGDVGQVAVEPDADAYWPDGAWLNVRIVAFDVDVPDTGDGEIVRFAFDDPVGEFGA